LTELPLADVILVAHFGLGTFISLGLVLIWIGIARKWVWTQNRGFRLLHLAAILVVAFEALAGIACPLTAWEDALRNSVGSQPSFVARWLQKLLYYDLPEWVFSVVYSVAALATAAAWAVSPPGRNR
jgi:hypothetical protein